MNEKRARSQHRWGTDSLMKARACEEGRTSWSAGEDEGQIQRGGMKSHQPGGAEAERTPTVQSAETRGDSISVGGLEGQLENDTGMEQALARL